MCEKKHLGEADFRQLLEGELESRDRVRLHLHLVDCEPCGAAFLSYDEQAACSYLIDHHGFEVVRRWRRVMGRPVSLPGPAVPLDLITALAAGEVLERREPHTWHLLTANLRPLRKPSSVLFLLETARDQWHDDPEEAKHRVYAAIQALEHATELESSTRATLFAQAYAYQGNIERIFGRYESAWEALDEAQRWAAASPLSKGFDAELAWFTGCLLRGERRLAEAIERLEIAVASTALTGGEESRLEAAVTLGITYGEVGRLDDSIRTLESVLARRAKSEFRPELYLATVQSLALRYVHVGQPEKARAMLHDIRTVAEDLGQHMNLLRVTWLEAEICHEEGNRVGAATRYREVQEGFLAKGIPYDAALASLSLAELHLEHNDTAAAAELAEELIPIFQTKGIHREATAAGLILVESLRREKATVDQVRQVAETVRASRSGSAAKDG